MTTTKTVSHISYIHSHTNFLLIYRRLAAAFDFQVSNYSPDNYYTCKHTSSLPKVPDKTCTFNTSQRDTLYATHFHVVEVCSWKCCESGSVALKYYTSECSKNCFRIENFSWGSMPPDPLQKASYMTATFQRLCGLHLLP